MTKLEYFQTLPPGVRNKAIKNTVNLNREGCAMLFSEHGSLHSALSCAFAWEDTPEGNTFWRNIASKPKAPWLKYKGKTVLVKADVLDVEDEDYTGNFTVCVKIGIERTWINHEPITSIVEEN